MIRPVVTELVLFFAPFVLYAVFLVATRSGVFDPQSWPLSRILRMRRVHIHVLCLVLVSCGPTS